MVRDKKGAKKNCIIIIVKNIKALGTAPWIFPHLVPRGGGAEAAALKKGVERRLLRIFAARRPRSKRLRATLIKRSLIFCSAEFALLVHTAARRREKSEFQRRRGVAAAAASFHATAFNLGANNNNFPPNNESQSSLERS
jgi:hypothetical protein